VDNKNDTIAVYSSVCVKDQSTLLPSRRPMDELEHMRIELLDPEWKEQKAVAEKRQIATNLGGADVARNVKRLAEGAREDDARTKRHRAYMDR
jgi:hypothetical protein